MLTETDDRVLAAVNLHAVLAALPRLAELAPDARALLAGLERPVTLTVAVRRDSARLDTLRLVFRSDGITRSDRVVGTRVSLVCASAGHLNGMVAGSATPVPVAGPAGLRFLTGVFTPLAELLGRVLQPLDDDLADPAFAALHRMLLLEVAVRAITVVAAHDRSGRYSAAQMPDGTLDIAVGEDGPRSRIDVRAHRLTLVAATPEPARAVFTFADLATAGDVLAGRESALACVGDGRIALRGYIPLLDNTSRILDRVGHYLGK